MRSWLWIVACAALLAGCRAPGPAIVAPEEPAYRPDPAELAERVARIRAGGAERGVLDVAPLADPQIADLHEAAIAAEGRGEFDRAAAYLDEALALDPDAPALLQHAAEVALLRAEFKDAVDWARRSFDLGPRLGGLCRRNWATIREAFELDGWPDAAESAERWYQTCTIPAPPRM